MGLRCTRFQSVHTLTVLKMEGGQMALMVSVAGSGEAGSELLEAEIRRADEHALVMLAGELDTSTAAMLYEKLAELARQGVRHVSLNLAELTFMDSTGLSILIAEHKRVEAMGGELIVFSPCAWVRRMIDITGLTDYFNIRPAKPDTAQ